MDWINAMPLNTYFAAYVDPVKSLPHKTLAGTVENPRGLAFWIPQQRYLANIEDYMEEVAKISMDEFVFDDPFLKKPLIRFFVEKGKSAIWDGELGNGMLAFQYSIDLMSYRKRDDGLLGIESISGMIDTRLSTAEMLKNPAKFPSQVQTTNSEEANFTEVFKEREDA